MNGTATATGRPIHRSLWVGLALSLALALLAWTVAQLRKSHLDQHLPVFGQVADFTLTNQHGQTVTLSDLRGHPWLADIIFTRCPGPCLQMTRQMAELQQAVPTSSTARFVSLTTDPDFDTPAILRSYAERFTVGSNRWLFLTGDKNQIARLAIDSLKLTALVKKPEERVSPTDFFIHSTTFVLVDKHGRLRGIYETSGESLDTAMVKKKVLTALRRLERER